MFLIPQYTSTAPDNAKLRFGIRVNSGVEQNVSGTGIALTTNAWTHVAVVRSGNTVSLYVNGSLAGSGTITLNPADLGVTTLNYLGKSQYNDPYLNGNLDDFRLYSQAMTAGEIAALANPAAGAPMQLAVVPGYGQATLTWLPNATTNYTVKRSMTSGGPYTTIATGLTNLAYTDTGLSNGVTYYYVVSGLGASGESPNSIEVSATTTPALKWTGAASANWDSVTTNWSDHGSGAAYQEGSSVLFDDTALSNVTINVSGTMSPSFMVVSNSSKSYGFSGSDISGAVSLLKQGSGTLTLSAANTFGGGLTINAGAVTLGNATSAGSGTITLNGGKLQNNTSADLTIGNNISVGGGGGTIGLISSGKNFTLNGALSGSGNLTIAPAGGPLNSLYLNFSANTASGTITIPNSSGINQTVTRFLTATAGSATAAWSIGGAQDRFTTLDFTGTIEFGSLSGSGTIQGDVSGIQTMSVGALNTTTTFSGVIKDASGTVALTKVGTGTMTLSGANTYTGPNNINAGKLIISTASLANGNYTVANGATFGVTNTTTGSATISNLIVSAGSALEFQRVTNKVTPLIVASNLAVNGSCSVIITGTNGLVSGNSYPLVSYAGTFSGNFTNLQLQMPYGWRGTLTNGANKISIANVAVVSTTSPVLNFTNTGQQLQFLWPADHTGWRLQTKTNLQDAAWQDISGPAGTNVISLPAANSSGFFRLIYP